MEGCETGRINKLPDDLLTFIISHLSGRDLMATSLVSRRWQNLWKRVPRLVLDLSRELNPDVVLSRILHCHEVSLTEVEICNDASSYCPNAEKWIPLLRHKSVTSLSLHCNTMVYDFDPYEILSIPSLEELWLTNFNFLDLGKPTVASIGLRSLQLDNAAIDDANLDTLIGNSPFLEVLCLSNCGDLKRPCFHSHILKHLEIEDCSDISSLRIDALALSTLLVHSLPISSDVLVNAPSLFSLNASSIDILERIYQNRGGMHYQEHLNNAETFGRLGRIVVEMAFNYEAAHVSWILSKCTTLQELGIMNGYGSFNLRIVRNFWEKRETFNCLQHHLKLVWIEGFGGEIMAMESVKFIIKNSLVLKRLEITRSHRCPAYTLEDVKSMPRGSSELKIVTLAPPQWDFGQWDYGQ